MTITCRDVIYRAYGLPGVVRNDDPSADEADWGLTGLQSMFDTWVAGGMFGRLNDVYTTAAYTALEGDRVFASGSPTITIPTTYADDGTEGTDRAPYDLSLIDVTNGATHNVWLYDRDAWVDLKGLTLGSSCPLAERGLNGLAACLAIEIADPAWSLTRSVNVAAFNFKTALSYKLGSTRPGREQTYF